MRRVVTVLLYPFLVLSAAGFGISLAIHIASLSGHLQVSKKFFVLFIGIFVVWLPAVIVVNLLGRDFKQKDLWKAALRGCPRWMRISPQILGGYAMLTFLLFVASGQKSTSIQAAMFSAYPMAFYGVAFAVLYSAVRSESYDKSRRCPNGHHVSPLAKYCEECGAAVIDQPSFDARPQ